LLLGTHGCRPPRAKRLYQHHCVSSALNAGIVPIDAARAGLAGHCGDSIEAGWGGEQCSPR
jgi:hypothetical protein